MSDTPATTEIKKWPKDLAAEKGMVNVQIDGVWYQFPRGMRIIEACRQVRVQVPHYCYHPKLTSPGNCRMCLVQMGMPPRPAPGVEPTRDEQGFEPIGWMPRAIIACANTVSENLGIRTTGELVDKCRQGVMEFMLINHPLDCPICDQAGECRLQEQSFQYGRSGSRFIDFKVKKPKNVDIGPRVRLDDERCIMCSRCIRFMDEVAGDPVLGFTQRGTHTTLAVHPDRLLDSNYSLNTVDICPVGALTSNDFRFQMRVWFLKETPSIDVNCGTGSNITIWTRGNKIHRITPRQNDEVNSAWMPDSHRLNFHYIDASTRLTQPLRKAGLQHEALSWADAISDVKVKLTQIGSEHTAIIGSARMTNEELFALKEFATEQQIQHVSFVPRSGEADELLVAADRNPNSTGAQLILGKANVYDNLAAIHEQVQSCKIKALIVWGEDLIADAGFTADELQGLELLVVAHHSANASAQVADYVLPSTTFAEKSGTMVNLSGRLQRLNSAATAPGEAKDDVAILAQLSQRAVATSPEQVFVAIATSVEAFRGQTWDSVGLQGVTISETAYQIPLLINERARKAAGLIHG